MGPDFSKNTKELLAKRAAYTCSNPDCRKLTVGANTDQHKSTLIGEAAHIYGARKGSKRYFEKMSDKARSEITNAIWLCRNCHKLIDSDENQYSSEVLFVWREVHDEYTLNNIGNTTDKILHQKNMNLTEEFSDYPAIIKRIVIDKPPVWEYRLTAELLKYFNTPIFQRLNDLRDGLYIKDQTHIKDHEVYDWVQQQLAEKKKLVSPLIPLINKLNSSWGEPGVEGDVTEIHHISKLIRDYLKSIVEFEEKLFFTHVSKRYSKILNLLSNNFGNQILKFKRIPLVLDDISAQIEDELNSGITNPNSETRVVEEVISFELPKGWEKQMNKELNRLHSSKLLDDDEVEGYGCGTILIILIFLWILFA
ncbi:HNH endonuclease [Kangiella sp. HZ709]|uniref:HNH endonuclease n=1 Tax=Kangiella sp. HZ709 TaxID=2666328 RepID=UPI0012B13F24|nr:HNH endonuclease [Kangiella sp. HZ709]MRX26891.1 hypothetical protein [Kangiella sp. HZ709]